MTFDILSFILGKRSVVPAVLQEKSVVPTAEGTEVVPDEGFNGLSKVNVSGDANLVPENIVSGTSIFGVEGTAGSGGGGSFPPGLYFESDGIGAPQQKNKTYFTYNDTTYCISLINSYSSYKIGAEIYKYENGAWALVTQDANMHYFAGQGSGAFIGILNGKAHLKASYYHYVFDGTTITTLTNFPSNVKVFIADGKLMYYYRSEFYLWDEATDTWTLEGTTSYSPHTFWSVGGKLYATDNSNKMYVYNNKTLEDTGFVFGGYRYGFCVIGDKVYTYDMTTVNRQCSLYILDCEAMTETKIGVFPYINISSTLCYSFFNDCGKLRFYSWREDIPINFLVHYVPA